MPLRQVKGKAYATLQWEVILPAGAPTITEKEIVQITIPSTEPGKPPKTMTDTYSVTSIELDFLRKLVTHQDHKK
jgi:hypothetical protein